MLGGWRAWCRDVTGEAVDAIHVLAEDEPEVVADHLLTLMARADPT